ncbi:nucleoside hydrolase [Bacillus idriensis]|uniref:Nucleoside hydrolase n=1 Tax=Metabacillus idriensis TaxID=324768 RepID=A0A6I2MB07_9BACI|nr:nucleoside hydrolase [Metabacillus idriensis]MRX52983.1 nucleoside hydrolase [Metabacillus idriensis]
MAIKILLFGDIGIDDIVALIYGALHDEIEIVGVVADYGNISRENAMASVQYLHGLFNQSDQIPIFEGAELPMTGENPTYYPEIHGEYGLGPIVPEQEYSGEGENFLEIAKVIEAHGNDLTIVSIGRLTSLATMFIHYKSLMNSVKAFYVMGGAFWVPGNVTPVSEANFHADPVAAKVVVTHARNLTIIPLNVTERAIVNQEMVDYIAGIGKVKILKPLLDYYYAFYKKRNPAAPGSPVHDALTIMAPLHPEMLTYKSLPVYIVQAKDGMERGHSIADIRPYTTFGETEKKHRIAFDLDYRLFFSNFMSTMTGERF